MSSIETKTSFLPQIANEVPHGISIRIPPSTRQFLDFLACPEKYQIVHIPVFAKETHYNSFLCFKTKLEKKRETYVALFKTLSIASVSFSSVKSKISSVKENPNF